MSLPGPVISVQAPGPSLGQGVSWEPEGPCLREGEGHRWLLFLSLPLLSSAPEETSAEEGTTRPSRGQCDAGHVIPPAVPVSSISFVTSHSVNGELGGDSPTRTVTAVTTGVGELTLGRKFSAALAPFSSCPSPQAWSIYSYPA